MSAVRIISPEPARREITAGTTMICPACRSGRMYVVDARASRTNLVIRRRRRCPICTHRVTTYERIGEGGQEENDLPYDRPSVRREAIRLLMELAEQLDPDEAVGATVPTASAGAGEETSCAPTAPSQPKTCNLPISHALIDPCPDCGHSETAE